MQQLRLLIIDGHDAAVWAVEGIVDPFFFKGGIVVLGKKPYPLCAHWTPGIIGILQPHRHAAKRGPVVEFKKIRGGKWWIFCRLAREVAYFQRPLNGMERGGHRCDPFP